MADPSSSTFESAFPRPTSLYQPERYTPSLLDSSSYSPFPTVAGSRADPFGLNAFLLHPEDQSWAYIAPAPLSESYLPQGKSSASQEKVEGGLAGKPKLSLRKVDSNAGMKKGSPLAQSTVPAGALSPPERKLVRRRSKSLDSTSSARNTVGVAAARDRIPEGTVEKVDKDKKSGTVGKKGLGRLFGRRKSTSNIAVVEDLPPIPRIPAALAASSSSTDVSTSGSNRSSLNLSDETSASSSASSIIGPATPHDSPDLPSNGFSPLSLKPETPFDDGSLRKKGLRGWLGIKTSKSALSVSSAESSPAASPNSSVTNFAQSPSVAIAQIPDPPSRIAPTPEQEPYAWVGDQLRRVSYRKLSQLRRPSPHPLAQQLRRQASHLPNEVASAFEIGQIIYPRSVNPRNPSSGLIPAQRGLWCLLHVKIVLDQLDRGLLPAGPMGKRPSLTHSASDRKARGMKDFILRPPFEDRHHVFYPNDIWSPVSIARPGFGVWDLDFSKYILALADSGEEENPGWPSLPRPSFLGVDELRTTDFEPAEQVAVSQEASPVLIVTALPVASSEESHKAASIVSTNSTTSDDDSACTVSSTVIATPPVLETVHAIPEIKIDLDQSDLVVSAAAFELDRQIDQIPASSSGAVSSSSSFRRSRIIQPTWDDSDDEDEVEEKSPKASMSTGMSGIHRSESQTLPSKDDLYPSHIESFARPSHQRHTRRISQPVQASQPIPKLSKRRSQFELAGDDEEKHRRAMAEVASARERRRALMSGEVDRRAEGELRRAEEAKRRSAIPAGATSATKPGTGRSASKPPTEEDMRRRTRSTNRASSTNQEGSTLRSSSLGQTKRFHSFYEMPASHSHSQLPSQPSQPYHKSGSYPSPQQFHPNPMSPHLHPGMPHSVSMSFPPSAMAYQGYQQPMFYPPSPHYGFAQPAAPMNMPNMGMPAAPFRGVQQSRSSLSLPDQRHAGRTRSSYA